MKYPGNMHKKELQILAIILLLHSTANGLMNEEEIKEKADGYISYDEVIISITPFNYSSKRYWRVSFLRSLQGNSYMIFDREGGAVNNISLLKQIATEFLLKENMDIYDVGNYMSLSDSYKKISQRFNTLSESFKQEEEAGRIYEALSQQADNAGNVNRYCAITATCLNKSITSPSPDDSGYLTYLNKTINQLKTMQKDYGTLIDDIRWWDDRISNKSDEGLAKQSIDFLADSRRDNERLIKEMEQNTDYLTDQSEIRVEDILCRIRSKEREPFTVPILLATIVIILLVITALHLWRE